MNLVGLVHMWHDLILTMLNGSWAFTQKYMKKWQKSIFTRNDIISNPIEISDSNCDTILQKRNSGFFKKVQTPTFSTVLEWTHQERDDRVKPGRILRDITYMGKRKPFCNTSHRKNDLATEMSYCLESRIWPWKNILTTSSLATTFLIFWYGPKYKA